MKTILVIALVTLFSGSLFCQRSTEVQSRYDHYMLRSQHQERAAIILVSVGAAVTAGSALLIVDGVNRNHHGNYGSDEVNTGDVEIVLGVFGSLLGVAAMSTSIPFFVGAHHSRVKAMTVSLREEQAPTLFRSSLARQNFPAVSLRIPLGR